MDPSTTHCLACGYELAGLPRRTCPECGADTAALHAAALARAKRRRGVWMGGVGGVVGVGGRHKPLLIAGVIVLCHADAWPRGWAIAPWDVFSWSRRLMESPLGVGVALLLVLWWLELGRKAGSRLNLPFHLWVTPFGGVLLAWVFAMSREDHLLDLHFFAGTLCLWGFFLLATWCLAPVRTLTTLAIPLAFTLFTAAASVLGVTALRLASGLEWSLIDDWRTTPPFNQYPFRNDEVILPLGLITLLAAVPLGVQVGGQVGRWRRHRPTKSP